jgi:hypothetical protein
VVRVRLQKIPHPLMPLGSAGTCPLDDEVTPIATLLFRVTGIASWDDVAPCVEAQILFVDRDEMVTAYPRSG